MGKRAQRLTGVVIALVSITTLARAQVPTADKLASDNAAVNRALVSPEVQPDGRVTFRLYAPKATGVTLEADWLQPPSPTTLAKNEQGIWSATVGPLAPDYYLYWFRVDGVMTPDPKNPAVKRGATGSPQNILRVPGQGAEFMEIMAVPHGEVRQVLYSSPTLGTQSRMHVYTPPGYDREGGRYPVLYLLHGGGETDASWSEVGRAGFILDNLLAGRKAVPMVVVMPDVPVPPARELFQEALLKDVMPFVQKTYRVRKGRQNQALAGYSVGGYEVLQMLSSQPQTFAYMAIWSAPVEGKTGTDFEERQSGFLRDSRRWNTSLKLLWFRIGSEDMGLPHVQRLSTLFTQHGLKNDLRVSSGGHRWTNWRRYLHEYAQAVFR